MTHIYTVPSYWVRRSLAIAGLTLITSAPLLTPVPALAAETVNVWWPTANARVAGVQPFKALVPGLDVSRYEMFWQVDGGSWNWMDSSYADYPHKEARVDLTNWKWRGAGPYQVNFIARRNGVIIATYPVTIFIDNGVATVQAAAPAPVTQSKTVSTTPPVPSSPVAPASVPTTTAAPAPAPAPVPAPAPTQTVITASASVPVPAPLPSSSVSSENPLSGLTFYVDPNAAAARQAAAWQTSNPTGASMMRTLASAPTAIWLGEWNASVADDVRRAVTSAQAQGAVPTFIAYAIPQRDCGGYSAGGTNNPNAYASWISSVASGIGSGKAVVVLEPDALSQITCLSGADQSARLSLLGNAVTTLKKNPGTKVYVDAGHSGWIDPSTMADRLTRANVASADGFALNVSNFMPTASEVTYGTAISGKVDGKHFVIDTARNGRGSNGEWCNPSGRAIGAKPTAATATALVDAFLWLKVPGESDGTCNGGPSAGTWWPEYALELVRNSQ